MNNDYGAAFVKLLDEYPEEKKGFKILCGLAVVGGVSIMFSTLVTIGLAVWWITG